MNKNLLLFFGYKVCYNCTILVRFENSASMMRREFSLKRCSEMAQKAPRVKISKEIALQLREQIMAGKYPIGSKLPTENELGRTFNVSRPSACGKHLLFWKRKD